MRFEKCTLHCIALGGAGAGLRAIVDLVPPPFRCDCGLPKDILERIRSILLTHSCALRKWPIAPLKRWSCFHEGAQERQWCALQHCMVYANAAVDFGGRQMAYAYKLNEDVRHQPQGPQGRAATDPPMIYTIVQRMPIEADGRLRYRIKSKSENVERVVTEDQLSYAQ